jgi:hypothetical protein
LLQIDAPIATSGTGAGLSFETWPTTQTYSSGATGRSDTNLIGDVINLSGNIVMHPGTNPKVLRRCTNFPAFNSGVTQTIDFNQNDQTSWFSASAGNYTVQVADYYMIHSIIKWITLSGSSGRRQIGIYVNGNVVAINSEPTTNVANYSIEVTYGQYFNIGDVISIKAFQNSDSALQADSPGTSLQIWRMT